MTTKVSNVSRDTDDNSRIYEGGRAMALLRRPRRRMTAGLLSLAQLPPQQQTGSKTMDLSKSTAFVSGANRGPGKHLADQLISRGARVYGGARKTETIDTSAGVIPVHVPM